MGVAASHAVGNAVNRNRAKRRIRACIEPVLPTICAGWDLIFLARKAIGRADYEQVRLAVSSLLGSAGLLVEVEK